MMAAPRPAYIPKAFVKLIHTRASLGLTQAEYSYLKDDPDPHIMATANAELPRGCTLKVHSSPRKRYVLWSATWPKHTQNTK